MLQIFGLFLLWIAQNFYFLILLIKSASASVSQIKDFDKSLQLKILLHLKSCSDIRNEKTIPNDFPYTGIFYSDLWANNIMFKPVKNKKWFTPIKCYTRGFFHFLDSLEQVNEVKFRFICALFDIFLFSERQ